jgi:hypothetical protein
LSFDFEHAVTSPFKMGPGLRRLPPASIQLTPNRPGARHLREKLAVFSTWPTEALLAKPGFDSLPALLHLCRQAAAEHPLAFSLAEGDRLEAHWLGWWATSAGAFGRIEGVASAWPEVGTCISGLAPRWRLAALIALALKEDLAVVDGRRATLPWLAVALPSHWAPAEKIGRHFAEVHAPVADNAMLITAGEHLMQLVTHTDRWERFVWNITPHRRLNHHPARVDPAGWDAHTPWADIGRVAWFRTERQTFIPVPERSQAVFTIAVDVEPLGSAIRTARQAQALHDAVATMSHDVLAYRKMHIVRSPLLRWLKARADGAPSE